MRLSRPFHLRWKKWHKILKIRVTFSHNLKLYKGWIKVPKMNFYMLFLRWNFFKVVFIRKNSRLLFALFVPLYFFIAQSSLQNRHTHISANGIVITHSHPVNHSGHDPLSAHDHSDSEICFYHLVQFDFFSVSPEIHFTIQADLSGEKYYVTDEKSCQQFLLHQNYNRGPPSFFNFFA